MAGFDLRVQGLDYTKQKLRARSARARNTKRTQLRVGYSAPYALFVHENLQARHAAGTQAKFLEQPMRQLRPVMGRIVREAFKRGKTFRQALLLAGNLVKSESQKLCPVDTGFLRSSAFVKVV